MKNQSTRPLCVAGNTLSNRELVELAKGLKTVEELEQVLGRLLTLNEAFRARSWAGLT